MGGFERWYQEGEHEDGDVEDEGEEGREEEEVGGVGELDDESENTVTFYRDRCRSRCLTDDHSRRPLRPDRSRSR